MLVTILCATLIHADEAVQVPKGVTYIPAKEQINDAARELLKERFKADATDEDVHALFDNYLSCGPSLWCDLKDDEGLAKLTNGKLHLVIPIRDQGRVVRHEILDGKVFQKSDEVLVFWKAFVKRAEFENLKIRKLNPLELRVFWWMISFDITEPVFMMESEKHQYLVMFTPPRADRPNEKLKICWIDDFQDLRQKYEAGKLAAVDK